MEHTVQALGARLQSMPIGQLETLQRSLAELFARVAGDTHAQPIEQPA
jgi:hypothetical protein